MALKFAYRLKVSSTGTSAAVLSLGAAKTGCRTLAQAIADGASDPTAIHVGDTGVPFTVEDDAGNSEDSLFTITSSTVITRESVLASSAGGTTPPTYSGALTVFNAMSASQARKLVQTTDGVEASALTAATSITDADSVLVVQGGALKIVTAAILKAYTGVASSTPTVVAPGQVPGLTAGAATETSQVLNWSAPSTGTAPFTYKVERSPAGANTWTTVNASVSGTTYTVTGLAASTPYDYRVSAVNSAGTGTASPTLTASTSAAATVAPGQVQGLTAGTPTDTTQPLSWTALSGASSYMIERSPAGANTWTSVATNVTGTTYTVTDLTPSTSYDYRVTGVNTTGAGTPSATVNKSTIATPAAPVTMASQYNVTAGTGSSFFTNGPTTTSVSGSDKNAQQNVAVFVKSIANGTPPVDSSMKFVWGKYDSTKTEAEQVCPSSFALGTLPANSLNGNTTAHTNAVAVGARKGSWADGQTGSAAYGLFAPSIYAWVGGASTPCDVVLWVMFSDGSNKMFTANAGGNYKWTLN